jgi:hypothetical protein
MVECLQNALDSVPNPPPHTHSGGHICLLTLAFITFLLHWAPSRTRTGSFYFGSGRSRSTREEEEGVVKVSDFGQACKSQV